MNIKKNAVVGLNYTLTDDQGEVIDSNQEDEALEYLHGHGQIVPGLESALDGRKVGDAFKVTVTPEEGYGKRDKEKIIEVDAGELPEDLEPEIGMQITAEGPDGEATALWIVDVHEGVVTLDGNHPLAGQTLHFDIQILSVREASSEELSHGHAHGPGHSH